MSESIEDKLKTKIRLRPANEEDIGFIFNSWLKSFRDSAAACRVQSTIYFSEQHKLIEKIVKASQVIVACNDEDPTQVFGYVCAHSVEGIFCMHYLYVKHSFRKLGLARILMNSFERSGAGIYTHKTRVMETFATKFNLVYHPYILNNDYLPPLKKEDN